MYEKMFKEKELQAKKIHTSYLNNKVEKLRCQNMR